MGLNRPAGTSRMDRGNGTVMVTVAEIKKRLGGGEFSIWKPTALAMWLAATEASVKLYEYEGCATVDIALNGHELREVVYILDYRGCHVAIDDGWTVEFDGERYDSIQDATDAVAASTMFDPYLASDAPCQVDLVVFAKRLLDCHRSDIEALVDSLHASMRPSSNAGRPTPKMARRRLT